MPTRVLVVDDEAEVRNAEPAQSVLQFGDVRLDIDKRPVTLAGADVHLTPIE
jgi:DNA-binding response OmpR family regulator